MNNIIPTPSDDLLVKVRANFVMKRTTFTAWCRARGVKHQNARKALKGHWNGPKASALRKEILRAAGM